MKVINNLVVVEVPKGAKQFEYFDKETLPPAIVVHLESDENGMPNLYPIQLPFTCAIIGLYKDIVNDEEKREEVLHYGHASGLVYTMLVDAGIDWQKLPDTTDLLFLKKVQQ